MARCTEVSWTMCPVNTSRWSKEGHAATLKPQKPVGIAWAAQTDSRSALGCALPTPGCGQQVASSDPPSRPAGLAQPPGGTPAPPSVTWGQRPPSWLPARCFHRHSNKKHVVWLVSVDICARPRVTLLSSTSATSFCPIGHKVTLPGNLPCRGLTFQCQSSKNACTYCNIFINI